MVNLLRFTIKPAKGVMDFYYRVQLEALRAASDSEKKDEEAKRLAQKTESELRNQFVKDIDEWMSVKRRKFSLSPIESSDKDSDWVFATGINCSVRPSQIPGAGRGLFASRFLKKGSVIEFFDGKVVSDSSVREFTNESGKFCTHCITLVRTLWTLDSSAVPVSAVEKMKGASFANSSVRSNASIKTKQDKALTTVAFLVAKQDILPNEEITVNYRLGL